MLIAAAAQASNIEIMRDHLLFWPEARLSNPPIARGVSLRLN